jgi:hypothetical protein
VVARSSQMFCMGFFIVFKSLTPSDSHVMFEQAPLL